MRLRFRPLIALLLTLLLASAGCSRPVLDLHAPLTLTWTGTALKGATFYARKLPRVTVHYAPPGSPDQAEQLGAVVTKYLDTLAKEGRCCSGASVSLWLLPPGAGWPEGVPAPMGGARAVAPGHVLVSDLAQAMRSGSGGPNQPPQVAYSLLVAMYEGPGSPVFAVDWLHAGMGAVLTADVERFPGVIWGNSGDLPPDLLTSPAALAALVADRYGLRWSAAFPRTPAEMTPEAALLWATGASDLETARKLAADRITFMRNARPQGGRGAGRDWVRTANDMSPVRAQPRLTALPPGPGAQPNRSPHRYDLTGRYDPQTYSVTGSVKLTWQNGEQIPVDTLYFHLWPNAEQFAQYGGATTVESVATDGKASAFTARGLDLAVPLGRAVAPGQEATVDIAFTTRLPRGAAGKKLGQEADGLFHLAYWYPTLAVLDDRGWNLTPLPAAFGEPYAEHAAYRVTLDVPASITIAATGRQTAREESGGRRIYRYEAAALQEWTAAGGPGLTETVRQAGATTLRVAGADPARAKAAGDLAAEALTRLGAKLDPLPREEVAVVLTSATSLPGLITLDPAVQDTAGWRPLLNWQAARLWFGGTAGSDRWGEPWLDHGFSQYAIRYLIRESGGGPLNSKPPEVHAALKLNHSTREYLRYGQFGEGVALRGALALEALEQQLGAAAFDRLLRQWLAQNRYNTGTTADFVRMAEAAAGRSLSGFWQQWAIDPAVREPYAPVLPPGTVSLP